MSHIVILGAMGSGKSTVGSLLAATLGWALLDNDTELHHTTGSTARAIAMRDGIGKLRQVESEVLAAMLRCPTQAVVTAPASATSTLHDNALAGHTVLYLRCAEDVLAARARAGNHRPIVRLSDAEVMHRSNRARLLADIEVDTTSATPAQTVQLILRNIMRRQ